MPDVNNYLRSVTKWTPTSAELAEEVEDIIKPSKIMYALPTKVTKWWPTTTNRLPPLASLLLMTKSSPQSPYYYTTKATQSLFKITTKQQPIKPTYIITITKPKHELPDYTSGYNNNNNNNKNAQNQKNPLYEIDRRTENLNNILLEYKNSNYQDNIDYILQQYLANMTRLIGDDENINEYLLNTGRIAGVDLNRYIARMLSTKLPRAETSTTAPMTTTTEPTTTIPITRISKTTYPFTFMRQETPKYFGIEGNLGCENLEDGEFVRDPNDCASFYTCFMGKVTTKTTCERGLAFDKRLRVCNWLNAVKILTFIILLNLLIVKNLENSLNEIFKFLYINKKQKKKI
jgi:hypothetical protein